MKYPLGYNTWDKRELKAINKVLMSGQYVMGKNVLNFEKNSLIILVQNML